MEWLNYHHLFYFWMITREGGLARAAAALHVSHSTVSAQLRSLEAFLGAALFERRGKRLVLTPLGAEVALYAGEIFRLGNELVDVARGRADAGPASLRVGVVGALPNALVRALLEPTLASRDKMRVHVRQGDMQRHLQDLAAHRLHLVLSDVPEPAGQVAPVHAHLLGETAIWLYGTPELAARYQPGFPDSLDGAPVLLPAPDSGLRHAMERWLAAHGPSVRVAGDADDAGLLTELGQTGRGLFPVRAVLRGEVEQRGGVPVGMLSGVRERYYALSVERRVRHRAVAAVIHSARDRFGAISERDASPGERAARAGRKTASPATKRKPRR